MTGSVVSFFNFCVNFNQCIFLSGTPLQTRDDNIQDISFFLNVLNSGYNTNNASNPNSNILNTLLDSFFNNNSKPTDAFYYDYYSQNECSELYFRNRICKKTNTYQEGKNSRYSSIIFPTRQGQYEIIKFLSHATVDLAWTCLISLLTTTPSLTSITSLMTPNMKKALINVSSREETPDNIMDIIKNKGNKTLFNASTMLVKNAATYSVSKLADLFNFKSFCILGSSLGRESEFHILGM